MPLYSFECAACGHFDRVFRKVDERNIAPSCTCCEMAGRGERAMQRIVEAPAVQTDLPGYQSPIDGKWVEGRRARTEDLKRSNCRPWEGMDTERKEAIKRAEEADRKFETQIERGIAETFNNMSAEKQRALETL
jgi:putative FmdB family regulatory protein